MVGRNEDPALPNSDSNCLQNDEIMDRDFNADANFERPAGWMQPLKKASSAATSSTLVGSWNTDSKRTIDSYNIGSKRTIEGLYPSDGPCVWSKMMSRSADMWQDDYDANGRSSDDESISERSCLATMKIITFSVIYELWHVLHTFRSHPYIPISTLCILAVLLGIGYLIAYKLSMIDHEAEEITFTASLQQLVVGTIILAFLISMMFMMIIILRQLHKQLLFKVIPQSAMRKLHRRQTVIERFNLVTIFYSDIVDFTSIAAEMMPIKAMEMLNELYASFDSIVDKYGLFKVETSGDTYMVVGGASDKISAPEAAEKVALFALEATEFVKEFRSSMGDQLSIRVGIASGPAMAAVVGKSMPRYCFLGEAVNFASRMALTSRTMKIQCSDLTFRLLNDAPNYFFVVEDRRDDGIIGVEVKGRGLMNTRWINSATKIENMTTINADVEHGRAANLKPQLCCAQFETISEQASLKLRRDEGHLVAKYIQRDQMMNRKAQLSDHHVRYDTDVQFEATTGQAWSNLGQDEGHLVAATADRNIMIDRIASVLEIRLIAVLQTRNQLPLDNVTRRELRAYVAHIETLYNHVEYHSFEHASHVTISMNKLIDMNCKTNHPQIGSTIYQNAFTSFMMVYSALVHDVGHTGKSNKILEEQNEEICRNYSPPLAERLSINMAIQALGRKEFSNLRALIIPTAEDKIEFAKILFCAILCTDVASQDTLTLVRERFDMANTMTQNRQNDQNDDVLNRRDNATSENFHQRLCPLLLYINDNKEALSLTDEDLERNRYKFLMTVTHVQHCVAIEHLMQAADVAHCMQGWENFIKWNYRLYKELMDCHRKDLMPEPSTNWSQGQIGFINSYILPLADRTETCFVLEENLSLAQLAKSNRQRWKNEGHFITPIFISAVKNGEDEKSVLEKCFAARKDSN